MPARNLVLVGASLVMALAGGIALGTGVLDGGDPEPAAASDRPAPQATPKDTAARAVADAYRASLGAAPVAGRLTGRSVVLVTLPGAPKTSVEAVGTAVRGAGGTVVGTVAFTDRLLDPADRLHAEFWQRTGRLHPDINLEHNEEALPHDQRGRVGTSTKWWI